MFLIFSANGNGIRKQRKQSIKISICIMQNWFYKNDTQVL